jgi:hypothetical protein
MNDPSQSPILFARHVAELWSVLAGEEISVTTVWSYLQKSKAANPATGREAGRYADDPMPEPKYEGGRPYWLPEQVPALTEWWLRRRGRIGDPRSAGDRDAQGKRTA